MKALPTALGVVFSQPDFAVPFWQKNIFALKGGGRLEGGGGGEALARGAGFAKWANETAWIFRKANQCPELHQGLVVEAGMALRNEAAGQGAQGG